jgi:SAM-dependent methyltransferase
MSERARWEARHREKSARSLRAPSAWVIEQALALPAEALVVDLAGGRGRHARPLAERGRRVIVIDIAESAVRDAGLPGIVAEATRLPVRERSLDAILSVNFLDRSIFPSLVRLLRPGGRLIVETFTVEQRRLGRGPTSPAHLLEPGELSTLVAPLMVMCAEEGLVSDASGERYVARIVAAKADPM